MKKNKKKIAISAINFFEGGPLSVLKDCLYTIENSKQLDEYEFVALVHKKSLFDVNFYRKIRFVELPKSRSSYFFRLYYEYIYFKKFAAENKIDFWFSLHDISPAVGNIPQAVYCHNPSPFKAIKLKDLFLQPIIFMFNFFYSFLYRINIKRNKYVIVQQLWLKDEFFKRYGVKYDKIVIANPEVPKIELDSIEGVSRKEKLFIFPTYPRSFKNIEVIGEAVKILNKKCLEGFSVSITIDGTENKYAKTICSTYGNLKNLNFIGLQSRESIYKLYGESDCLIFPSTLETWGLPISEYKLFRKPMIIANLPYAKETVGMYDKIKFFNPLDAKFLANYMEELIISGNINFDKTTEIKYPQPCVQNWEELLFLLIK
jgi:hypothetical protein